MSFFNELKRRNVFKVGIAYVVVAWLVAQVLQLIFESFGTPDWVMKTVLVLLATGAPFAIFFAWAFEMTPEGLKRESEIDRSQSITHETGQKLNYTIIAVLVLALGYFAYDKFFISAEREAALVETATQAVTEQAVAESNEEIDHSIAVLPFADMSPDQDQEYFTDGLSEELLNLLAKIPELKVASRSSSFQFKDKGVDILEAAKQLNVAHVLEGSVRKDGNQLRITAQLIKADDGFHLWSETYDRELESVFAIQDEIAKAVVGALRVTLLGAAPKSKVTNPEAYALYLQGRYLYNQRGPENWNKAVTALQKSLALDPDYPPAWAVISSVYADQADFGEIDAIQGMALARSSVERALSLDPDSAAAWASLGYIRWGYDWNWEGAAEADLKALELEPGNVEVITQSARVKETLGFSEEAIALNKKAISLDPLSLRPIANLGLSLMNHGDLNEAEQMYRRLINLNAGFANAYASLGQILILKGSAREAIAEIEKETFHVWKLYALAFAYYELGEMKKADEVLEEFIDGYGTVAAFQIASILSYRGEIDLAFEWLDRAYAQRDGGMTALIYDSWLSNTHSDPRWELVLEKVGLLKYWHAKKEREASILP